MATGVVMALPIESTGARVHVCYTPIDSIGVSAAIAIASSSTSVAAEPSGGEL